MRSVTGRKGSRAARSTLAVGAPTSAAALLRLPFEALLRAAWCMYAASQPKLDKLTQALDAEAETAAKNMAGLADMLEAVRKKAPPGLAQPLNERHLSSRRALNSFVHTGIHALHQSRHAFPTELSGEIVRLSNGLLHLTYRLLGVLTGPQSLTDGITQTWLSFADSLPGARRRHV
jgi:hypothetical protein